MRVLSVHGFHSERAPSGEDIAVRELEEALTPLVDVLPFHMNASGEMSSFHRGLESIVSPKQRSRLLDCVGQGRVDIIHVHSDFGGFDPRLSRWLENLGAPKLRTLHNFRPWCPAGTMHTSHRAECGRCVQRRIPWPALVEDCGLNSSAKFVAAMRHMMTGAHHRVRRDWHFVAPSHYVARRVRELELERSRVSVIPIPVRLQTEHRTRTSLDRGTQVVVYAGRFNYLKGVDRVIRLAREVEGEDFDFRLLGGVRADLDRLGLALPANITVVGPVPNEVVHRELQAATVSLAPSRLNETFGRTVFESLGVGTPVLGSGSGALGDYNHMPGYRVTDFDRPEIAGGHLKELLRATSSLSTGRLVEAYEAYASPQAVAKQYVELYELKLQRDYP